MPEPDTPEPERKIPEMPEPETPELERKPQEIPERKIPGSDQEISEMPEKETQEMTELAQKSSEGIKVLSDCEKRSMKQNCAENLLRGRQRFQPFQDEEFTDCVQIKLCDILPLQQENWQVGRSNFLQHGYYLYRHLLLGRAKNGGYILGVPGVRSQQEEYMAYTFGYDQFKLSALRGCGQRYGYWYRILKEPEYSSVSTESKL
ncbi:MAG: hypothetical protein LUH07_15150 [Lachnospiraceae bacterium]|nr:hypothetical protein [Lachnospiraceae bacterium]